jgi:hypothetical protein
VIRNLTGGEREACHASDWNRRIRREDDRRKTGTTAPLGRKIK